MTDALRCACALLLLTGLLVGAPARAEEAPETVDGPAPGAVAEPDEAPSGPTLLRLDQGFTLDLPQGWVLEEADDDPGDATGRRVVREVCETAACARTKETCTLRLRTEAVEGADDGARLAGLHAAPLSRSFRLRAVLKGTSADAAVCRWVPIASGPVTGSPSRPRRRRGSSRACSRKR